MLTANLQNVISQKCRSRPLDFILYRQLLASIRCYRNVNFDLPEFNAENVTVGGILKLGVTFGNDSFSFGKIIAVVDCPLKRNTPIKFGDENSHG